MSDRVIRLAVRFPTVRKGGWQEFCRDLFSAMDDLRVASNRAMTRLWCARTGASAWPVRDGDERLPQQTYAYALYAGTQGIEAVYAARRPRTRLGGGVLADAARRIVDRLRTDYRLIMRGEKSLPSFTWRFLPLRRQELTMLPDGRWAATVWAKGQGRGRIVMAVRARGASQRATLRRVLAGEQDYRSAELRWDKRNHRFELLLVVRQDERPTGSPQASGPMSVAIDLARSEVRTQIYDVARDRFGYPERVQFPRSFWRVFRRLLDERRERGRSNARELGLREGRGRGRKVRPIEATGRKYENVMDDAGKKIASVVARRAREAGVVEAVVEDVRGGAEALLEATETLRGKARRHARNVFLRANRYRLQRAIVDALERDGVTVTLAGSVDEPPKGRP